MFVDAHPLSLKAAAINRAPLQHQNCCWLDRPSHPVKSFCALLALGLAWFGYWYFHRPITYPPGVLIASEPEQVAVAGGAKPIDYHAFHLQPLAHFTIDARVLHRKIYRYDRPAELVPVDLALGWGPMSDQHVLDQLRISQSMRFYWYEYQRQPPIPKDQIISHSTNIHVIPSTTAIASRCKSLRTGSLVHLSGELVEATGPGIGTWRSSLSRTDTGNGACELMWVEKMSVLNADSTQDRHLASKRRGGASAPSLDAKEMRRKAAVK